MAEKDTSKKIKKYKFRELKVYSSTEWLADNKKKYRQVFDRYETTYVYAELSFYNKMYDRENWDVDVELRCYQLLVNNKQVCTLNFKRKVSKYDSVVYVREGWGNKKDGAFWKRGTYFWETWIDGEKVATKYFYIEDVGSGMLEGFNPYLELVSLKLYEGQYDDLSEEDRNYYKVFSSSAARYIYAEVTLKNLSRKVDWQCELFTKFYNSARELKGQVIRLQKVNQKDEIIKIDAGWGSNIKGSWREGNYTVEVVFMDRLIAVIPFDVGEDYEEGQNLIQLPGEDGPVYLDANEELNLSFDEIYARLDNLIGLTSIKQKIKDHAQYVQFIKLRKQNGFEEAERLNVHSVFIGNPGTGKTTVAKMMGLLYRKMGLLSKGHVHEVDRVDLVGEYIGQTAPKVKEAIQKARGGVLFIDEAYALARTNDDSKDFGREVIEMLVKEMSNGIGDLVVIVAGYPKEMKHFLDSNPGLKSRFKLYYDFADYLPQELQQICQYACAKKEVVLSGDAQEAMDLMITEAFRLRDRTFGNARYVFDLVEKAKINLGIRVMQGNENVRSNKDLETIQLIDVDRLKAEQENILPNIPTDLGLLESSLAELDALIGMDGIKKEIHELVTLVQYYRETSQDVLNQFYLHTVFVGNPGTGKTTVARILTKIYKALGILERGRMIETDRQGLVAGFVGQTAIKTSEKIDEANGGVLFIDEAYALTSSTSGHSDYGQEVIQTLLKRMEDERGKFFVFVAGYPENMDKFLKANPGFSSRFDKILRFEDYSPEELYDIALKMCVDRKVKMSKKGGRHLEEMCQQIYQYRDKYFGNARVIRGIVEEAIRNMHLRLSVTTKTGIKRKVSTTISYEDVATINPESNKSLYNRKGIGY